MRKLWHRFLFWLYEDFLTFYFERQNLHIRDYLNLRFEHTESELEATSSRVLHVVSERARYLEEQIKRLEQRQEEHAKSFEEFRQQTEARFAQVMALWYGKTPQDWDTPPARPPKDFTWEDRQ